MNSDCSFSSSPGGGIGNTFRAIDATRRTVFLADATRYARLFFIVPVFLRAIIGDSLQGAIVVVVGDFHDEGNLVLVLALGPLLAARLGVLSLDVDGAARGRVWHRLDDLLEEVERLDGLDGVFAVGVSADGGGRAGMAQGQRCGGDGKRGERDGTRTGGTPRPSSRRAQR